MSVLVIWGLWPSIAAASEGDSGTLSFDQALIIAEREAPALQAQSAAVAAADHAVEPADALPDPQAFIGMDSVPIEGSQRLAFGTEPMSMQTLGIRQAVPNRAKRTARRAEASAGLARARAEQKIVVARVRRETAAAWIETYYAEQGLALFDEWERESRLLIETTTALIESGRTEGSDALLARREALTVDALRARQLARATAARARLRAWVGEAAEANLVGEPPAFEIGPEQLQHRLHDHPELELYGSLAAEAQARVAAAEAEKRPDWAVELGYQRRPDFDDMIALQISVDLPLFTRHRQDPLIEAERQRTIQVEAQRAAVYREHAGMLQADLADYHRLEGDAERLTSQTLPLMQELVNLRLAEYRGGEGVLADVIRARLALLETRLELIDTRSARATLAAELRYAYLENDE